MSELSMSSLEKGKIYIHGEITERTSLNFLYKSDYIIESDIKNVKIYIQTEGGDVPSALAIADRMAIMKDLGINIITIGIGEVASAGVFILIEGNKRYCTTNTTLMIHPMIHTLGSDYHAFIKEYATFHEGFYNNLMTDLAMKCGKKTPKEIQKFLSKISESVWLDVDGAIKLGLIHERWSAESEKSK